MYKLLKISLFCALVFSGSIQAASLERFSSLKDVDALIEIWGKHALKNAQTRTPGVDKGAAIFHGSYDWHSSVHSHFAAAFAAHHLNQPALYEALIKKYTQGAVISELFYPSWGEATYGFPWLLLYADYLLEVNPKAYKTLKPLINKAYNSAYMTTLGLSFGVYKRSLNSGYKNFNFVLFAIYRYAKKIGDAPRMEHAENLLKAYAPKINWQEVGAGDFFEPKALAALVYKEVGLKGEAWDRLAAFYATSNLAVPTNFSQLSAHHKGKVLSAALGDWIMYEQTKEKKYLKAFIAKIDAGYQETKPDDDFVGTGHWLPGLGVFILKQLKDTKQPVTPAALRVSASPKVFIDYLDVKVSSDKPFAQAKLQIINWANTVVKEQTFNVNKGKQSIRVSGLKSLWAEKYTLKLTIGTQAFNLPVTRKSWW